MYNITTTVLLLLLFTWCTLGRRIFNCFDSLIHHTMAPSFYSLIIHSTLWFYCLSYRFLPPLLFIFSKQCFLSCVSISYVWTGWWPKNTLGRKCSSWRPQAVMLTVFIVNVFRNYLQKYHIIFVQNYRYSRISIQCVKIREDIFSHDSSLCLRRKM